MGTDIHCILQKKDSEKLGKSKGEKWITVLPEHVFVARDHTLFAFLAEHGTALQIDDDIFDKAEDALTDFDRRTLDECKRIGGLFIGYHSWGYITLDTFCNTLLPTEEPKLLDHVTMERKGTSFAIHFPNLNQLEDIEESEYYHMRSLQRGLAYLFEDKSNYRLVYGFDC